MFGQTTRSNRTWWRNEFYDHPGRAQKLDDAYVVSSGGTKVEKVYCKPCFDADVNELLVRDEADLNLGRQNDQQSKEEIIAYCTSKLVFSVRSRNHWLTIT
jgi:hypothetical protein